jgi:putative NADPH-quinone reductase
LLIVFPLWLDQAPMMLRDFFSRIVTWQSANCPSATIAIPPASIRAIVTMEMPAFAHRAAFREPAPNKPALALPGLNIARPTFIGSVRHLSQERRARWINELHSDGLRGV